MFLCIHTSIRARRHAHTYIHKPVHTCKHTCKYTYIHTYKQTCKRTYTQTYAQTYTYTHIHTHTHRHTSLCIFQTSLTIVQSHLRILRIHNHICKESFHIELILIYVIGFKLICAHMCAESSTNSALKWLIQYRADLNLRHQILTNLSSHVCRVFDNYRIKTSHCI